MNVIFFIFSVLAVIAVFNIFRGIVNVRWIRMVLGPLLLIVFWIGLGWLLGCLFGERTLLSVLGGMGGAGYYLWELFH